MSDTPNLTRVEALQKAALEERRIRQYQELKNWDSGRITPHQCIDNIIELESVIFLGNKLKEPPKRLKK